jgi:ubiquinone/menaquinone biosynthesis C-methylase UbiE
MMTVVPQGQYARKQLGSRARVVAWSHRARFGRALQLAGEAPGEKLLDYGCGDGTFLGLVSERFRECWGADIRLDYLEDCRTRFQGVANVHFCSVSDLAGAEHNHAYAVVTCMETLEHCTEPVIDTVLEDLKQLCSPGGRIIISVPVEIGPTFLFKYAIRKVLAWRGLREYRGYESYSLANALRMVFSTEKTAIPRPVTGPPGFEKHSHYGFNWRRLRRRVAQSLLIERVEFSPLGFLGGWVSSQVWFICRPPQANGKLSS